MKARAKTFVCKTCGKEFQSDKWDKNRTPKFCSRKCAAMSNAVWKTCPTCGIRFYDYTHDKFCSRECANAALRGVSLSAEHREKLSEARKNSPKCHGENLYNWKGGKDTFAERMKIHYHKRRSAQHIAVDKEYLSILRKYQQNRCFYCGQDMGEHPAIEHLTPVSHGGDNQRWNLVYSCRSCNSKKHDKTMEEYAITTGDVYGISNRYDAILARVYAPYMEQLNKR